MANIQKPKREKIVAQVLEEITHARRYKQGKIKNWQLNEDMYYGKKVHSNEARANVDLDRFTPYI
jgi:hypothetical protein